MREKRNDQGKQKQDPTFLLQSRDLKWKAGRSFELVTQAGMASGTTLARSRNHTTCKHHAPCIVYEKTFGIILHRSFLGLLFDFGAEVAGVGAVIHVGMCSHFVGQVSRWRSDPTKGPCAWRSCFWRIHMRCVKPP